MNGQGDKALGDSGFWGEAPVTGGGEAEGPLVPLLALVARPGFSLVAQSGVALLLWASGQPQPFRRAARWWMVYGTAVDVGCGALLAAAARREGVSLRAAAGAGCRPRRSLRAASLDVAALVPAAIGSQLLGRWLGPDPADPYPPQIRVSRLRGAARMYSVTVWPVLWAVCEESTYLGYAFPRLERWYGAGRSAALVSLAWAAQHAAMPVLPGRRYALSRVAAMLPVSAAFTLVYLARGRRLAPLIAAHWASDLSAALLAAALAAGEARRDDARPAASAVVLPLTSQGSAQATRSARSRIPRSIFWLITKLTASTGSTRKRADGRVQAYLSRTSSRVVPPGSSRSTQAQVKS